MSRRPEAGPPQRTAKAWLDRPAGWPATLLLAAALLAAPAWLMADVLRSFRLLVDDFVYLAYAREGRTLLDNLLTPHNTHLVPLFRLETFALASLAGRLSRMPQVFLAASYGTLMAAMSSAGVLIGREMRSAAAGLAAMAVLGITTVVEPAVVWYSAGQALAAGVVILWTLLGAQAWSRAPSAWRLGLTAVGALAAPLVWTGGLAAGPAAAGYVWAGSAPRRRLVAGVLLFATAAAGAGIATAARRTIRETPMLWEHHPELWPRPIQAAVNTAQAIPEVLVLANLGLDAPTAPMQGAVLTLGLVAAWAWTRRGAGRIRPLEAAGGIVILFSFLLVYYFRGNFAYENLRDLGWYHAIPQVGGVLLAAGWWEAARRARTGPSRLTRRGAAVVMALGLALLLTQEPRALRRLLERAPKMTPSEARRFLLTELKRVRAVGLLEEERARQVRALRRLDLAEDTARRLGIGRAAIRAAFGRVIVPGIPEKQRGTDAVDLLRLPEEGAVSDQARVLAALGDFLRQEPPLRPTWLEPGEAWPAD